MSEELLRKEYGGVRKVAGPLLFVERASDLPFNAIVRIRTPAGGELHGQVIEVSEELAVVQVFEETIGLDVVNTTISLVDREARLGVSEDLIGRIFNGAGRPLDGLPAPVAEERRQRGRLPHQPGGPGAAAGLRAHRPLGHRRLQHPGARPEAADLLGLRPAGQRDRRAHPAPGAGRRGREPVRRGLRRHRHHPARAGLLPGGSSRRPGRAAAP